MKIKIAGIKLMVILAAGLVNASSIAAEAPTKQVIIAERHFDVLKTSVVAGDDHGKKILDLLRKREITWNELIFTSADLEREMRAASIRQVNYHFRERKANSKDFNFHVKKALDIMASRNLTNWDDFSFTKDDFRFAMYKFYSNEATDSLIRKDYPNAQLNLLRSYSFR